MTKLMNVSLTIRPIMIFDLDGTLFNINHRLFHINDPDRNNRDHKAFNLAADGDTPIKSMFQFLDTVFLSGQYQIVFVTGRKEYIRDITVEMLTANSVMNESDIELHMTSENDWSGGAKTKEKWYLKYPDKERVTIAIEDSTSVVEMWRKYNVICFQCAKTP